VQNQAVFILESVLFLPKNVVFWGSFEMTHNWQREIFWHIQKNNDTSLLYLYLRTPKRYPSSNPETPATTPLIQSTGWRTPQKKGGALIKRHTPNRINLNNFFFTLQCGCLLYYHRYCCW
jgi:hypothetical protein